MKILKALEKRYKELKEQNPFEARLAGLKEAIEIVREEIAGEIE